MAVNADELIRLTQHRDDINAEKVGTKLQISDPPSACSAGDLFMGIKVTGSDPEKWLSLEFSGLNLDSSQIKPGELFLALPGLKTHGAKYARMAVNRGAKAIFTDPTGISYLAETGILNVDPEVPSFAEKDDFIFSAADEEVPVLIHPNPRAVTGLLAANFYQHPAEKLDLFAVTGTNGKTTTSYMLAAMLEAGFPEAPGFLTGTVETRIGKQVIPAQKTTAEAPVLQKQLALAVAAGCQTGVVEASSHALEMSRLVGTHFCGAGFTNLTPEHLDYHGDMASYAAAKAKVFTKEYSDFGVICVDTEWGQWIADHCEIPHFTVSVLSDHEADWRVTDIKVTGQITGTEITLLGPQGEFFRLRTKMLGRVLAQNMAVAFLLAYLSGVDPEKAISGLAQMPVVSGRMNSFGADDPDLPLVIVDFAHTPEAVEQLLQSVQEIPHRNINVVISADGERQSSHRSAMGKIVAESADALWVTDSNPRFEDPAAIRAEILSGITQVRPALDNVYEVTTWRTDAVRKAILSSDPSDIVVLPIKGTEPYQEIMGVKHSYSDDQVVKEVLSAYPRLHK